MIPEERIDKIKSLLSQKKHIGINELCKLLYCSKSTIRRDLIYLEKAGLVRRTRGGVSIISNSTIEYSSYIRSIENKDKKIAICKKATEYLKDDMCLFLDSSSTVNYLCSFLSSFNNIKVITNGLGAALALNSLENVQVFVTGGELKSQSNSLLGEFGGEFINHFYSDLSIISCKCLDESAAYEIDPSQALIKSHMMKNSKKTILLCDSSKLGKSSFYKLGYLKDFNVIITDKKPPTSIYSNIINEECTIEYY